MNKFCCSSCAASYNNVRKPKKTKQGTLKCLNCQNDILGKNAKKFCCNQCQQDYQTQQKYIEIEKNGKFPIVNSIYTKEINRPFVRKYLISKFGHKCSICGNTHWLGNPILLIVDHIDGDIDNHKIENYRLVCSNCDATLPTYKNKNRGKGKRKYRRMKE